MNWQQITELCESESRQLRPQLAAPESFFPRAGGSAAAFIDYERDTNDAVAVAVRQFTAERTWPELRPIEQFMLGFRLDFAAGLAGLLAVQPAPWTDSEEAEHDENRLGWLLLHAWEQEGFPSLHQNLLRILPPEA